MNLEFTLSRSLIKPKFTFILAIGLILGVSFLLMILTLFQNYYRSSEKTFMGIHPHVEIHHKGMTQIKGQDLAEQLKREYEMVLDARPAIYQVHNTTLAFSDRIKALCMSDGQETSCFNEYAFDDDMKLITNYGYKIREKAQHSFLIKGIQIQDNTALMDLQGVINGSTKLELLQQNQDQRGMPLPWSFYLEEGIFKKAHFLEDFLIEMGDGRHQPMFLRGSLSLGAKKGKHPILIMSLANAQSICQLQGQINTIEMKLKDPYVAASFAKDLQQKLGPSFEVRSWIENERASFIFLNTIKMMIFAIVFSICLVAGTSIISTLTMSVRENHKKIAILKALGLKDRSILSVFLLNTGFIGLLGIVLGSLLGLFGSTQVVAHFKENLASVGIHNPSIHVNPSDLSIIAIATLALCFLSAILPALNAIRLETVDGLNE